jgi:hypothetical protein
MGVHPPGAPVTARTAHLDLSATISDTVAAPGHRLSVVAEVTPRPTMHLYAPGAHDYQVVQLTLDPQVWLRVHDTVYPASEISHFAPLDERVEVYSRPFRLQRDFTLLATPEMQNCSAACRPPRSRARSYQACDDKVCFNPARVPVSFTVALKPVDRKPPGA